MKKLTRIERHYEDGTIEYIDGEALENYNSNMNVANGICLSRSYIKFKPVDWKEIKPVVNPDVEKSINEFNEYASSINSELK
jgi:hypothetical protein